MTGVTLSRPELMYSVDLMASKTRRKQTPLSLVPAVYISTGCGREKRINEDRNFCFVCMKCFTRTFWMCKIWYSNVVWQQILSSNL